MRLMQVHEANINPTLVAECLLAVINLLTTTFESHLSDDKVTKGADLLLAAALTFSFQLEYHTWLPDNVFRGMTRLNPIITRYRQLSDEAKKNASPRSVHPPI